MDINDLTGQVIGAAIEVHKILGPGLLESAYEECLCWELEQRTIPFEREKQLPLEYRGQKLSKTYFVDFLCYDQIVVELKAVKALSADHEAQVINYLRAGKFQLGLLVNFSKPKLDWKRLVRLYEGVEAVN